MIADGFTYVSVLIFFASFILAAERATGWAVFRVIPGVVFIYAGSMLLSTLGLWGMAATKPIYRELSTILTYAMIFTMLLRSDVRKIFCLGPRMLLGFCAATVTIAAGFVVSFLVMKEYLGANAWMPLGALSGSWIGGYDNIAEIQTALHIPLIDMEGAFIVDSIDYTVWVMFLFWLVTLAPRFNRRIGADTTKLDAVTQAIEHDDARRTGSISFQGVFLILGTALLVAAVGANIGPLLYIAMPFFTKSIWTILFILIFGLIAAFSPLGRIAGSMEIANVMLYSLIALTASRTSLLQFGDAPAWVLAGFIILGVHLLLMMLIARIFKLDMFTLCISSMANIGGAASAPILASLYSGALIPVGIFLAIIGHFIGTPLGLWIAHLLKTLV
ncbi:MAG: DUF819 domain-containing protein [Selenomonas sp.]|nr:DUF819 family protein [uncultured Selenomonas sp.]